MRYFIILFCVFMIWNVHITLSRPNENKIDEFDNDHDSVSTLTVKGLPQSLGNRGTGQQNAVIVSSTTLHENSKKPITGPKPTSGSSGTTSNNAFLSSILAFLPAEFKAFLAQLFNYFTQRELMNGTVQKNQRDIGEDYVDFLLSRGVGQQNAVITSTTTLDGDSRKPISKPKPISGSSLGVHSKPSSGTTNFNGFWGATQAPSPAQFNTFLNHFFKYFTQRQIMNNKEEINQRGISEDGVNEDSPVSSEVGQQSNNNIASSANAFLTHEAFARPTETEVKWLSTNYEPTSPKGNGIGNAVITSVTTVDAGSKKPVKPTGGYVQNPSFSDIFPFISGFWPPPPPPPPPPCFGPLHPPTNALIWPYPPPPWVFFGLPPPLF